MPFFYRLQKILDFRIKKKEEQLQEVIKAQERVYQVERRIEENERNIKVQRESMRKADPQMYETYDNFLKFLYDQADSLKVELQYALDELEEEKRKLIELEKAVNVLEKHKEKNREDYIAEEKKVELKRLSELAVQRHFAKTRNDAEELELEEYEQRMLDEG